MTDAWPDAKGKDVAVKDRVRTADGTVIDVIGRWTKRKGDVLAPMATIAQQIRSAHSRAEVVGSTVTTLTRTLAIAGFRIDHQDQNSVVYIKSLWRTVWDAWVIFLPIALIQGRQRVTLSFMDAPDGGTFINIAGTASRRVARQFAKLAT